MRKIFLTGLATFLPIAITLLIFFFIFDVVTAPFVGFIEHLLKSYDFTLAKQSDWIILLISRIIVLILLFVVIFLLGLLGQRFILSPIIKSTHALLNKIPIVKVIYRVVGDITKNTLTKETKGLFKGTAVVPFPDEKTYAMGLISGPPPQAVTEREKSHENLKGKKLQSVFIPTSPHPISGFLVLYGKEDIKKVDIKTEDLFKFLLSCGAFQPGDQRDKGREHDE